MIAVRKKRKDVLVVEAELGGWYMNPSFSDRVYNFITIKDDLYLFTCYKDTADLPDICWWCKDVILEKFTGTLTFGEVDIIIIEGKVQ